MITDIYRIKTMNSIYEIRVSDYGVSRCRKEAAGTSWKQVKGDTKFLDRLYIGASFDVPGVVQTSNVEDYSHFVLSQEPKRTTVSGALQMVVEGIKEQLNPQAMMVAAPARVYKGYGPGCSETNHVGSCTCDLPPTCDVPGCDYSSKYGPGHDGARMCKSGSIASGGTRAHCACDYCY